MAKISLTLLNKIILNMAIVVTFWTLVMAVSNKMDPPCSWHPVTATVYHPTAAQTDDTPLITASNARINPDDPLSQRFIALSRDLEERFELKFGDKLYIQNAGPYDGCWIFQDRMHYRWENRIDFLIGQHDPVGKWDEAELQICKRL